MVLWKKNRIIMEHSGHLEGMLDRDQRTAKLRFFDESDIKPVPKTYSFQDNAVSGPTPPKRHCCCPTRTKRSSSSSTISSHLACRNGYLLNTFQSVKNFLIVVCLTLLVIPCVSSAAIDPRMNSRMKWVNPCDTIQGSGISENTKITEFNSSELRDIIAEATSALSQATIFSENFTMETFHKSKEQVHSDFQNHNLSWLELEWLGNKHLDESIAEDHLQNLKIEDVLLKVYGILQRVAVGLEQITWDQKNNTVNFEANFSESEHHLKRVLCELHQVIDAHGLEFPPDATRDIMSQSERHVDSSRRKGRDWMIFREYMNSLQFLKDALEHLKKDLTKASER